MAKRVYLDTNVYCRPLDDQTSHRVRSEARAFTLIADAALHQKIIIVSSDYVKFEIEKIADPLKRKDIRGFERALSSVNITSSEELVALATGFLSKCSLNSLDALHMSASCLGEADFLTCDDKISDEKDCIENLAVERGYRLKVGNPVNYVKERRRGKR
ncbi:hypothetical protein MUP01_04370 [Candidatus Bathyarchaeota archaeon]|nr:hypothetical protein [Candidatus Bathyarchaeota archaeon]